jgi:leader peptidase (prepilin peptidase)/N-methyltransferase
LALFGTYFVLALLYPPGMGFGDVKLAGLVGGVGAYVSWSTVLTATLVSFGAGAVAGLAVVVSRRGTRRTVLPFGPFMLAATVLAVLLAPAAGT